MATKLMLMAAVFASSDPPPDIVKLGSSTISELKEWWERNAHLFWSKLANVAEEQHGASGREFIERMGFSEKWWYDHETRKMKLRPGWEE